jgi:Ca-activated chloride channel family protein
MTWNMDDPRWTAYVLGELAGAERDELEHMLEQDAEARAYVASLREAIGAIERELRAQPPTPLDDLQRRRIRQAALARPSRHRRWVAASITAAIASLAAIVMFTMRARQDEQLALSSSASSAAKQELRMATRSIVQERPELNPPSQAQQFAQENHVTAPTATKVGMFGNAPSSGFARIVSNLGMIAPDPAPGHNTEAYSRIDETPFFRTQRNPLSTFSIDVDTASYANVRRFIAGGARPPKDAVRIEEMINYFKYAYPPPGNADPFSITTEVGPAPWDTRHQLVRIGLQAMPIDDAQVPPRNLVFLIDTSGSMHQPNKLPLLVQSLGMLVDGLRPQDRVAIAVYAGAAGLVLDPTSNKDEIRSALSRLEAGGSTNGGAGIQLAYDIATRHLIRGGINRVILCSDGDMNVGITSEGDLTRLIETERERGVFLTVLGFGMGNLKDATMEKLADRGNGNYAYIDSLLEARKVLVKEAGATLVTVAKDVKLQIELNPATVAGYRLIGYENRILQHQDFNDDKKDAGDIGAGQSVTAIYEIVPAGVDVPSSDVDQLKYQPKASPASNAGELLTIKIRYKAPAGTTSKLLSRIVTTSSAHDALATTSNDYRWAAAIAGLGMLLRESPYRGNLSWQQVQSLAEGAVGSDAEGYRKQALAMIADASKLPPAP